MPIKKTDKKSKKKVQKIMTQKQTQIVNINLAKKSSSKKSVSKAPIKQASSNTYYQPVSQSSNSFSLADIAKVINQSKTPTYVPQSVSNPVPKPIKEEKTFINYPIKEERYPIKEERTLPHLPTPEEILKQIQEKNKLRKKLIIEDENEDENTPISALPEIKPKRNRRTKQQMEDAREMFKEDVASYNLRLNQFN